MRKLLIYLKGYKKETVLAPLFKLLEACFDLFVPLVVAYIIDRGIAERDMGSIAGAGGLLLLLAAVGLTCAITAQYYAARAAVGFATGLRQAVFDHIQKMSFTNLDKVGVSGLITRMTSDINQVQSGVNMVLRLFLRSPIIVFGAMIMAFTIDVKSALVFVVAIPALTVLVFGIMLLTMPLYRKVQGALDKVLGITRENLSGVRVIRAFHQEHREEQRFLEEHDALTDLQKFVGKISGLMNPATSLVVNGAIMVLIYLGALQVNVGNLTQGEVIAILNYMSQILVELVKLANLMILTTKAFACADRVAAVLEIQNEEMRSEADSSVKETERYISDPRTETKDSVGGIDAEEKLSEDKNVVPYLQFSHVSLTYQGAGDAALEGIDFTVNKGDTIGIIGGTGSGKSSLVNLIPGFYPATRGEVRLEGQDIRTMDPEALRSRIGIVPQKAVLFGGTIRSNLLWRKQDATDAELWQALDLAQAREVVEGKEGGLDAPVSQKGRNFSGGQRQRLTIARALVGNPEILILDDSASALDYATDAKLRSALQTLGKEATVFIVSQRASSLRHADAILVLEDGEMAGFGTHEELLQNCAVYQEIYFSQFPEEKNGKGGEAS